MTMVLEAQTKAITRRRQTKRNSLKRSWNIERTKRKHENAEGIFLRMTSYNTGNLEGRETATRQKERG